MKKSGEENKTEVKEETVEEKGRRDSTKKRNERNDRREKY